MAIVSYKSLDTSLAGVIPIIDIGNYKRKPMRNLTVLFLFLSLFGSSSLGIIKLSSCSEYQANVKCIQTEREALLSLKEGLIDHSGRLSSWVGEDCCQWRGIECNKKSGHVTKLDLRNPFEFGCFETRLTTTYTNSCMGGEISSSLTHLKYLNYLDLSLNYFGDIQIPEFFGMLENLMYLNLSIASFSGEIPPHLGNLSRLMYLDLHDYYDNRKFVRNLGWLSSLSSLKYLNMGGVNLNSAKAYWLQAVNMLPSLLELHLRYCELESLPSSIAFVNFTSLFVLDLSGNQFNSSIIQLLFNITSLTKLDLSFNSFQGIIPYDAANLINLEDLDLSNNYIIGPLPSLLGNLCKLKTLDLSSSNIDHNIDELFGNFSNCLNNSLESLDMRDNMLVGKIPDSLGRLGSLRYLNLQFNSIWGSIPDSIGRLSSLQQLDLSDNEMNGTIPKSLGQLSKLVYLNLDWNSWEGVITKAHLMNLTRLEEFTLRTDKNQSLIFNVTYDWIPPFKLRTLELQNCLIGLKFPKWLQVQSELINVILRNVGITDTIPKKWFSRISSQLIVFDLSNNQIMGKLPHSLVFPNADFIDLSYNCLQGPIPLWYTNGTRLSLKSNFFSGHIPSNIDDLMQGLACLDLSNNLLNGTIPLSIQQMTELRILILRSNKLSGELPHHWNESQSLWALDVAYNSLSGKIPSSMGCLRYLNILVLSNNNLYGEIPNSLQNCSLKSIDLGENLFSGNLPSWIQSNTELLRLRSNMFSGVIPRQWCNIPAIHILDVAQNKLSGGIPNCLDNLTALIYGYSNSSSHATYFTFTNYMQETIIVTKGRELEFDKTLSLVNTIDLSCNNLTGGIPNEITSLAVLGTLNLSMNHLTGNIPKNIGNLRWLETLDLSNNSLSGPIPESMSSLTFLAHLNLSFNNLVGRIPFGNQLQTLNDISIYKGNPLLCGSPLSTNCPWDEASKGSTSTGGSVGDKRYGVDYERLGFYVSIGLGFVVGFWSVCGTLLVKKSWRHWYFCFCDDIKDKIALIIALKVVNLKRKFGLEKI